MDPYNKISLKPQDAVYIDLGGSHAHTDRIQSDKAGLVSANWREQAVVETGLEGRGWRTGKISASQS